MKQANPKKRTYRYCVKCGHAVQYERILDYPFYCPHCDENMYTLKHTEEDELQGKSKSKGCYRSGQMVFGRD